VSPVKLSDLVVVGFICAVIGYLLGWITRPRRWDR